MIKVTGRTKVIGVIGYPIEHSKSPAMHNRALEYLKLDYIYVPFSVKPGLLKEAIGSLRALNLRGINVTIPHKENVIRYLDRVDPLAGKIGAVNTIVNDNGILTGYNTDASGFLKSLRKKFDPKRRNIFLLGAGGAAKAIAYILLTQRVKGIYISDKDNRKALELVKRLAAKNVLFIPFSGDKIKSLMPETDLFINATPLGMHKGDPRVIDPAWMHKGLFVYDVVYNLKSRLIKDAELRKIPHISGVDMFVNQGAVSFEYWLKKPAPVKIMREAVK